MENFYSSTDSITGGKNDTLRNSLTARKLKRFFKNSAALPFAIVLVFVALVAFFAIKTVADKQTAPAAVLQGTDQKMDIKKARAQQTLTKEFTFPLKDQTGKVISNIKYEVVNAEIRDQIIIKGEKATAVQGRTFLIINLKITNSYNKTVQINAKDYIRLIAGSSNEKLAPDIHNDPVEVQAISTKYTRVGFPIDDPYKNLALQIGEIEGSKQTIKLDLR